MSGFDAIGPEGFGPGGLNGAYGPRPRLIGEAAPQPDGSDSSDGFANSLGAVLDKIDSLQNDTKTKAQQLAMGEPVEVSDLMVSMGKSEVAFNLMLEVRNKIVDAWERLSRSVG